ncbi:MAG: hypothetical protein A2X36_08355 [Elusimicrobia bacterium GWA2_69_24]|nr:MAG: hypothetical protein A2X36_08355 [Elusimicrobia bacterium GWA2_69_24]HBL15379.1 hypothetical protein [Elusimicrobiota bacterium]
MQCPLHNPWLVVLSVAATVAGIALFVQLVNGILARMSGWAALAERYPLRGQAPPPATSMGYGAFRGWLGYNGCLIIAVDDTGFYLAGWPIFLAPTHKPIHIPWGELTEIRLHKLLWARSFQLVARSAPEVDFRLNERTFALIRARIPPTVPIIGE